MLQTALREIAALASIRRVSSLYRSDPVGFPDQPDFWNLAAEISWSGSAEELLAELQRIERQLGRIRRFADGPREIDIDILDFGGEVRGRPDPVLPHPRLTSRRFALVPLSEIAPRWRHPVTRKTAAQMAEDLPEKPGVRKMQTRRRGDARTR